METKKIRFFDPDKWMSFRPLKIDAASETHDPSANPGGIIFTRDDRMCLCTSSRKGHSRETCADNVGTEATDVTDVTEVTEELRKAHKNGASREFHHYQGYYPGGRFTGFSTFETDQGIKYKTFYESSEITDIFIKIENKFRGYQSFKTLSSEKQQQHSVIDGVKAWKISDGSMYVEEYKDGKRDGKATFALTSQDYLAIRNFEKGRQVRAQASEIGEHKEFRNYKDDRP